VLQTLVHHGADPGCAALSTQTLTALVANLRHLGEVYVRVFFGGSSEAGIPHAHTTGGI